MTTVSTFFSIGLYDEGSKALLMHSDEMAHLFFENPEPRYLKIILDRSKPFPYGLVTNVGMLIATAAFLPEDPHQSSSPESSHGEDIWSFQQGLAALGLTIQEDRGDLPLSLAQQIAKSKDIMKDVLTKTNAYVGMEFWTPVCIPGKNQIQEWRHRRCAMRSAKHCAANSPEVASKAFLEYVDKLLPAHRELAARAGLTRLALTN